MKSYILLLALTRAVLASNEPLLGRAPIPGAVSLRYSRSTTQLQKRDKDVNLAVGNSYFSNVVNVTVGTPPQPITMTLDTGSSDAVLLTHESSYCQSIDGIDDFCGGFGYYNPNKSSSYNYLNSNFNSSFGFSSQGEGSGAIGDVATDSFTIAGATIKNQLFDVAYGNFSIAFSILGLGYAAGENQVNANPPQPQYDNIPLSLAKQGATNLALFSLWTNNATGGEGYTDGQVLFGGIDTTKYTGKLTTFETQVRDGYKSPTAFDVLVNGLALSGDSSFPKGSTGSVPSVLDCGTSVTILPDDWVQPIHKQFDVTYYKGNDTAYIDCDEGTKPYTIDFSFLSLKISVPMSAMVSRYEDDTCTFGLVPAGSRHALLGENFLTSAYTVFDISNNQISLAPRNFSSTTDNIMAVPVGGVTAITDATTTPSSTTSSGSSPSSTGTATGTGASSTPSKHSAGMVLFIPTSLRLLAVGILSLVLL